LVEVTPKSFRLRKKLLSIDDRKREQKRRDMALQNA
jgi:GTP-binding protein